MPYALIYELWRLRRTASSRLQAALVRFSSFTVKELGRNATYSQADVLDVTWDVDTGGSQVIMPMALPTLLLRAETERETSLNLCNVKDRTGYPDPDLAISFHPKANPILKSRPTATLQLDVILAEHLAEKFNAELGNGGDDVRKNPKAMAKLIRQARFCDCAAGRSS